MYKSNLRLLRDVRDGQARSVRGDAAESDAKMASWPRWDGVFACLLLLLLLLMLVQKLTKHGGVRGLY